MRKTFTIPYKTSPANAFVYKNGGIKDFFPLQPYRISLFRGHSGRSNDMDPKEYATFRYETVEVEVPWLNVTENIGHVTRKL